MDFTRRLTRGQLIGLDCLAGWAIAMVSLTSAAGTQAPAPVKVALALGLGAPLAVRRLWPVSVFALVLTVSVVASGSGVVSMAYLSPTYALYLVALERPGRVPSSVVAIVTVVTALTLAVAGAPAGWLQGVGDVLFGLAAMGGAWTVGRAVHERRIYAARAAERLVTEERLRIARELHDVVAHSMGLIAVKAGVANHVMRSRPEEAHAALKVIESASRDALTEMRHLLGVLRTEPPDLRPVPELAELAARARLAGVGVELRASGVDELPEGVRLAVHRIVQEALTNVVKHAAPAPCRVTVAAESGQAYVEVIDEGPARRTSPGPVEGHGLIGMRERVMMYGGTFSAGPGPSGGFRVAATLPYP
ncbi:sensor histidine kinase [Nonomuraea africana]|uniref:histidine kinase n=1 Tax=Nonomuraea africana TaxID=46171 RepID=A0ABR9KL21_9ACTN|nr:histidine kinase [Nonomuraea africana]MBE1562500.1 signal transduction histidine kinase [Nonomuraea africana]